MEKDSYQNFNFLELRVCMTQEQVTSYCLTAEHVLFKLKKTINSATEEERENLKLTLQCLTKIFHSIQPVQQILSFIASELSVIRQRQARLGQESKDLEKRFQNRQCLPNARQPAHSTQSFRRQPFREEKKIFKKKNSNNCEKTTSSSIFNDLRVFIIILGFIVGMHIYIASEPCINTTSFMQNAPKTEQNTTISSCCSKLEQVLNQYRDQSERFKIQKIIIITYCSVSITLFFVFWNICKKKQQRARVERTPSQQIQRIASLGSQGASPPEVQ